MVYIKELLQRNFSYPGSLGQRVQFHCTVMGIIILTHIYNDSLHIGFEDGNWGELGLTFLFFMIQAVLYLFSAIAIEKRVLTVSQKEFFLPRIVLNWILIFAVSSLLLLMVDLGFLMWEGEVLSKGEVLSTLIFDTANDFPRFMLVIGIVFGLYSHRKRVLKQTDVKNEIILPIPSGHEVLSVKNILSISANENYISISTLIDDVVHEETYRMTMKKIEELLPVEQFMRIHRSAIVNLHFVTKIEKSIVTMKDGSSLTVSKNKLTDLKNRVERYRTVS